MKTLEELGVSGGNWNLWSNPIGCGVQNAYHDLAHCHGFKAPIDRAEEEANGRLMAASKKMYEALLAAELAVAQLCEGQDPANECWNSLANIRAAIAAAGGA